MDEVAGSQCIYVAIDDHSRYASVSIMEDETAESVTKNFISMPLEAYLLNECYQIMDLDISQKCLQRPAKH